MYLCTQVGGNLLHILKIYATKENWLAFSDESMNGSPGFTIKNYHMNEWVCTPTITPESSESNTSV